MKVRQLLLLTFSQGAGPRPRSLCSLAASGPTSATHHPVKFHADRCCPAHRASPMIGERFMVLFDQFIYLHHLAVSFSRECNRMQWAAVCLCSTASACMCFLNRHCMNGPSHTHSNAHTHSDTLTQCMRRQLCPFSHPGEKAKRRSLDKYNYSAEMCALVRNGERCPLGDQCPKSHNLFEQWLHPDKFRTVLCYEGTACQRKVCSLHLECRPCMLACLHARVHARMLACTGACMHEVDVHVSKHPCMHEGKWKRPAWDVHAASTTPVSRTCTVICGNSGCMRATAQAAEVYQGRIMPEQQPSHVRQCYP